MGILEIVFNSRKFDLNDDVLMGFYNYFDKKSNHHIIELTDRKKIDHMIILYWD